MAFAVNFVDQFVQELTPSSGVLPKEVMSCFSLIHAARVYWHHGRYWKKHADLDNNLLKIAADQGVHFLLGGNKAVQFGAKCLHILRCLTDMTNEYNKMHKAYTKVENFVWGYFPILDETPWEKEVSSESLYSLVVNTTENYLKTKIYNIKVLGIKITKVVKCMFKLSMHAMDTVEAISTNEIVSNVIRIKEKNPFNGEFAEEILNKLKKNRPLIQKIIIQIDRNATVDQLIEYLEGSLQKGQEVVVKTAEVSNSVFNLGSIIVKELSFSLASIFGLVGSLPNCLAPDLCIPSTTSKAEFGRFVPRKLITLKKLQPKNYAQKVNEENKQKAENLQINLSAKQLKRLQTYFSPRQTPICLQKI